MQTYKIQLQETLSKIIEIQASNIDEAIRIVQESYQNEDIVLDWGDFVLVEFDDVSDQKLLRISLAVILLIQVNG